MRRALWSSLAVLMLSALAVSQSQPKRGPSTAEERTRFAALTQKLQKSPLDPELRPEVRWALQWLIEVPDVTVDICTAPLGEFMKKKYKYSPEIVTQLTFSSGQFVIEHPDQVKDTGAQHVAGVEGALKAYQAILKAQPEAKSKELDELLQKQSQGTLGEYVRGAAAKGCKSNNASAGS